MAFFVSKGFYRTGLAAKGAICYTMDILRKGGNSYFING